MKLIVVSSDGTRFLSGETVTLSFRRRCGALQRGRSALRRLMAKLFGIEAMHSRRPLMYQGMSHRFLGPRDDVPLPLDAHGIDFEGEFGVITDEVPMGVTPQFAAAHIKLEMVRAAVQIAAIYGLKPATVEEARARFRI
jgi:Fumarylacetoacetate (FAA) hydrolase family